jgi:hypothetical protein
MQMGVLEKRSRAGRPKVGSFRSANPEHVPELNKEQILSHVQTHGLRTVLVVTALPLEMKAVRAHLAHLGSVQGHSGTIYECGQFSATGSEWLVVVAQSGAGIHPAHNHVTQAHMDFGSFELIVFVGIAGSRKVEASIGSVVASNYVYFPYSGKHDPVLAFTAQRWSGTRVGEDLRCDVSEVHGALDARTVLIAGSAPCYPYGVFDDISRLGELAVEKMCGCMWMRASADSLRRLRVMRGIQYRRSISPYRAYQEAA